MTGDDDRMTELGRNESWLADALSADPPVSLEQAKLRARIDVDQLWLRRNAAPDPAVGNLGDVKRALRTEVEALAAVSPTRARARWRWVRRGAGLAAAAVVVFGVGLALYRPHVSDDRALYADRLDDWIDAVVLDASAPTDDSAGLASLKSGVDSLEMGLSGDWATAWVDEELDDLDEDLEALLTEIG